MIDFPVDATIQIGSAAWPEGTIHSFVELYRALENRRLEYVLVLSPNKSVTVTITLEGYDPISFVLASPRQSASENGYGVRNLEYLFENTVEPALPVQLSTTAWEDLL